MHFFVSYAKKDTRPLALALAQALEAPPDMTAWVDQELRATGSNWSRQIEREIQRCDYLVVLLSPDVNRSEEHEAGESFVLKEIEYMILLKKERRIIVVMAQDTLMPLILTGKQYIDFRGQSDAVALADRICDEIGIPRASERGAAQKTAVPAPVRTAEPERPKAPVPAERITTPIPQAGLAPQSRRWLLAAGAVVLAVIGIGLAVALNNPGANVPPATTPASVAQNPTDTPAPTGTATETPTLSSIAQFETMQMQLTESVLTLDVMASETAIGALALMLSWTPTPTPTPTATPTPTPNPDPMQAALEAARAFSGSNADWQALYPDGFIHTFEDGVSMALVPAGCFMMGTTDEQAMYAINTLGAQADWVKNEQPANRQCFDAPFWIDLTEVTQADFERLGGAKANANRFDGAQRPVERINWFEAWDFCALRGARLPTEREWEYAARGPDALIYPWGNTWDENKVVWLGNSNGETAAVGSIPAGRSWAGGYDLSGNVYEWVSSLYLPYDSSEDREADTGTRTDVLRVLRGGSWGDDLTTNLRASFRDGYDPDFRGSVRGFRCARSS
ncbi:MAG: SUMF1/EgtB/PvdO family nonheme iron enzyme [Anaerolineae bacterium]|nr:SUMF1/EgtB/PvdO family nonheme iron enzyme [Anaerolineae bacterium]